MLKRTRENEDGFTLIELMVVVLIISILIAIAIPTFLGAREGAQDRGTQSNLRNALTAADVIYADENRYSDTQANLEAELAAVEPSLQFQAANPADGSDANLVGVTRDSANETTFVGRSASGDCFFLKSLKANPAATVDGVDAAGTWFGTDTGCDGLDGNYVQGGW